MAKKTPEVLAIRMSTVDIDGRCLTEASCEVEDHKAALRLFKDFLKTHGTGFNDFDTFTCRFVTKMPKGAT